VFNLSANINDAPPALTESVLLTRLAGDRGPAVLQLRQVTRALRAAAHDDRVKGVLLTGSLAPDGYGTGFAALKEVRAALHEFKVTKKPIVAYLDTATTRDFYLAAGADDLVLDPYGVVFMPGLASEPMFYAGALEKFGVGVQVSRVGKFKSAVEPFTRTDLSPESREQLQALLGDLWSELLGDIAADRGLPAADIQALVDREGFLRAETAVSAKLVSRQAYRDEVVADLKKITGPDRTKKTFRQVSLADYIADLPAAPVEDLLTKTPHIAVVYAEGAIVDGDGGDGEVGGARFARELRRLRQDDSVKAIVLRVNSPGGSVSGSEHIQRELRLARVAKPVIVSMGSYAASGGYWISAYGKRIFAEPASITGSIGVFSVFFDVKKLANNLGLTFDRVQTGAHADLETIARPKTPEELALFQKTVDWIYDEFISKVAEGRKLDPAKVREIAEGRVWSGTAAIKLGLVDEIGGLDAALAYAAKEAGLSADTPIEEFPHSRELTDVITSLLDDTRRPSDQLLHTQVPGVVTRLTAGLKTQTRMLEQFNDRLGVYARLPFSVTAP
ncbi:MAG: signal peptide peptidase SppA, partial [Verrucomicrobiota bacterium]